MNEVCVQNTASSLNMGQDYIIKEIVATTQDGEQGGTTNQVSYQNTASSLHLEQDCTKNHVSNIINEEFAMKMTTTEEEEHVCTTNTVLVQNIGSTHEEGIYANTSSSVVYYLVALRWRVWNLRRMKQKIGALQDPEKTKTNVFCI